MKRLSLLGFVGLLASVLAGCPIWDNGHSSTNPCVGDACSSGGGGLPGSCTSSANCAPNETCGDDAQCHPGDCTLWGCVSPLTCVVDPNTMTASCQQGGAGGGGTGGAPATTSTSTGPGTSTSTGQGGATTSTGTGTSTSTSTGAGGAAPVYCGNPKDCAAGQTCSADTECHAGDCTANGCISGYTCGADGTCKRSNPAACATDSECSALGQGYACVSGICTKPSDQCFDQTQCAGVDKCAAGKCTPACSSDADCGMSSGYKCDTSLGICTTPSKPCTITNDCGGPSTVCVAGACVPRSNGLTCPSGQSWVDNGCIANQQAQFVCATEGVQDACAMGSLCLHHSCYIACDPAQSPNACTNLPVTNQCKSVTASAVSYNVCGSNANLGSDCGPSNNNKTCSAGKVCIDGFCK